MDEMVYVLEREESPALPSLDLSMFEVLAPAEDALPFALDAITGEMRPLTEAEYELVVKMFGDNQDKWPEYPAFEAEHLKFQQDLAALRAGLLDARDEAV